MLVIHAADIDERALLRNGTGTITIRPHRFKDEGGVDTPAYAVMADFFPAGTDQRNFRTLEHAMALATGLVIAAEEAARRLHIRPTIEVHLEIPARP